MPPATGGSIGISDHLARRLYPIALAIAVVIGVAPPATYYVFQRLALEHTASIYAASLSELLHDIVLDSPALWRYSTHRYAKTLVGFLRHRDIVRIDVQDEAGRSVEHYAYVAPDAARWARAFAPSASAPVRFNNRLIATVRVHLSHALLLGTTAAFVVVSTLTGAGLAVLVYRFPVKVGRAAEAQIAGLVGALERERQTLDRRVKETDTLLEIARATESTNNAEELFSLIAESARRTCRADRAAVLALDGPDHHLRLAAMSSADGQSDGQLLAQWPSPLPFVEDTIAGRMPTIVLDADQASTVPPDWRRVFDTKSMFAVPLSDRNSIVGVLVLGYSEGRPPTAGEEVRVAATLAEQVGLALHNAFLIRNLRDTVVQLREKNAELDSFVYSVSHDLKAPLVAVQGLAGLIVEDYGARLDDEGRHFLGRLQVNVKRMEQLIQDLLELSRVGRESRPPAAVHLAEVIDDVVTEMAGTIRERGIKMSTRDLGPLWGVPTRIGQVMSNLIGNAIKYMGDSPSPAIEVGMREAGPLAECWVRDNGIGIDPQYHDKIFEIFQRLGDVEAEGTGVGLAITRKIVESVGGRIWVESTKGNGATFWFTWPTPGKRTA